MIGYPANPASRAPGAPSNKTFHTFIVEGFHFSGRVTHQLELVSGTSAVALHPALGIYETADGWALCRFNQGKPVIVMAGMTQAGAELLAAEFGIQMGYLGNAVPFHETPAFTGLQAWAKAHPVMAKRAVCVARTLGEAASFAAARAA